MSNYKFLVVEDDANIREIIALELEGEWENAEIIEADSGNQAIEIITNNQDLSCIISDLNMNEGTGTEFFKFLKSFEINIPFVLVTGDHIDHHKDFKEIKVAKGQLSYLKKPFDGVELIDIVAKALSVQLDKEQNQYKRISMDRFKLIRDFPMDIYIKKTETEYVKIAKAKDGYLDNMDETYKNRGLTEFFTTTKEYIAFIKHLDETLRKRIRSKKVGINKKLEFQLDSIKHIHESLKGLGFKEQALDLAKENVKTCMDLVRSDANLAGMLGKIIKENQFTFSLGLLTSYISVCIGSETQWTSRQALEKLAMAGIFQDISLPDENLVRLKGIENSQYNNLAPKEQEMVVTHPQRSVEYIKKLEFSSDLKNLIISHHERPGKGGFPSKKPDNAISPLACIHILANEFSYRILKTPLYEQDLKNAVEWMEENCVQGNFKKAFEAFKKAFKKGLNKGK